MSSASVESQPNLSPLVSRLAASWVATAPAEQHRRFTASVLSADISGFTPLTERLAKQGREGAEQLTLIVNNAFSSLIEGAERYGGDVVSFGGDAIFVLFDGADHGYRASQAAIEMQRSMETTKSRRNVSLSMTIGIDSGSVDAFLVGSDFRQLILTGPVVSNALRLESDAEEGEVLVGPNVLIPRQDGDRGTGGISLYRTPPEQIPARPIVGAEAQTLVPQELADQLVAVETIQGEHRLATMGFVHYTGTDERARRRPESLATDLTTLIDAVRHHSEVHGVSLLQADVAADGGKLLLSAGVPVSAGHEEEAMVRTLHDITKLDLGLELRAGIQRGWVFAGFTGSTDRRAYTVMGDGVNTAARLLGRCDPGQVLATNEVLEQIVTPLRLRALAPFHVKGKRDPLEAAHVDHIDRAPMPFDHSDGPPLVGRDAEIELLQGLMAAAVDGPGSAIDVHGDAGIGKSRLVQAAVEVASGLRVLRVPAYRYESSAAYSTARDLLRAVFELEVEADADSDGELLLSVIRSAAPDLLPLAPLVADVLGASVPTTPEASAIEPEFRPARTAEATVELLEAVLGPASIILEDFHWVDDSSRQLLSRLARATSDQPWVVIFVRRRDPLAVIEGVPDLVDLSLQPLRGEAVRELAVSAAWPETLTDSAIEAVLTQADGNPLFAIELAAFATNDDSNQLPETVETLITTRIDELPPRPRLILRLMAALGSEFEERIAVEMLQREVPDYSGTELAVLMEYVVRVDPQRMAFVHTLHRDVAYEGLPFGVRRSLHGTIGSLLEDRVDEGEFVEPGVLALHFSVAEAHEKTWRYAVVAGDDADRRYATAEAIDAYERAIGAARYLRRLTKPERFDACEALGRVLNRAGRYEESLASYERAQRYAGDDDMLYARVARGKANCLADLGQFQRALGWSGRGASRLAAHDDSDAHVLEAGLLRWEAGVLTRLNNWTEARSRAEQCRQLARSVGAELEEAQACDQLAMMSDMVDVDDAEDHAARALELFEKLGNPQGVASVWNNRGVHRYYEGRWVEAREAYLQAVAAYDRSGDESRAEIARNNLGEILSDQGHLAEAAELFEHARRSWEASGFTVGVALTDINLGRVAKRSGDHPDAVAKLTTGLEGFTELGMTDFVAEAHLRLAECQLAAGRPDAVESHLRALQAAIEDSSPRPGLAAAQDLVRAGTALASGDVDRAESLVRSAVESSRADGAGFELAEAIASAQSLGLDVGEPDELATWIDRLGLTTLAMPDGFDPRP